MIGTKTRILDAAEQILAEHGFAACSLRDVTAAAGTNLGAVNYHFRSKEALIRAVFERRLHPINDQRLAALDECERRSAGRPVPMAHLLHAFIDPLFKSDQDGRGIMRLIGRMYTEPSLDLHHLLQAELELTVRRFLGAFRRSLPGLKVDDLGWRLFFVIGATAHTLAAGDLLKLISGGICDPADLEDAASRLVQFACAGLKGAARRETPVRRRPRRAPAGMPAGRARSRVRVHA